MKPTLRLLLFFTILGLGANLSFASNYKSNKTVITNLENLNHVTYIAPSAESDETEDAFSTFLYFKLCFSQCRWKRPNITSTPIPQHLTYALLSYLSLFNHSPPL